MKALAEGSSEDVRYLRVMLIGPAGVGKTSLLDRMMDKEPAIKANSTKMAVTHHLWAKAKRDTKRWNEVSEEDKVLEIAKLLQKAKIKSQNSTGSNVSPRIETVMYPTAMKPDAMIPESSRPEVFVQSSVEVSSHEVSKILAKSEKSTGNSNSNRLESDFEKRVKSLNDQFTESVLMKAYEVADQLGDGKEENETYLYVWDCGGQPVYLNALPPFLSAVAAFLVIFDVTKDLNSNVELKWNDEGEQLESANLSISYTDLITQWMAAIDSYVPRKLDMFIGDPRPRVITVGTNSQASDQKRHRQQFNSFFEKEFEGTTYFDLVERDTKLVENEKNTGDFSEIHDFVMNVAEDFVMKTPVKWVLFRKILSTVAEKKPIVSLNEAISIGKVCNIEKEVVHSVLDFYHELGVFLFYPKENIIIASPKWLVEKFGCLLCHEKQLEKICNTRNALILFCKHGILVDDLYKDVFKKHTDMQNINLIDILSKFSLAAEVTINLPRSPYNGLKGHFVPTMLSQSHNEIAMPNYHLSTGPLYLHIPSRNYIPPGFYVQLLVALTNNKDFVLDSSTAGYNTVSFKYQRNFIVSVSAKSTTHVEITLYRNHIRKEGKSYFCNICQDVFKAIISATRELPLKNLLKGFDVQPALLHKVSTPDRPRFVDIGLNQMLEENEECDNVIPDAKLWLNQRKYEVCFSSFFNFSL